MSQTISEDAVSPELKSAKPQVLLAFHRVCWEEMTWRRNAGYRTIILGLAYCGLLLAAVAYTPRMPTGVRVCLAAVIALATLFGAGYMASNYYKYTSAAARMILIEQYLGAFDADYLGPLGPLMKQDRRDWISLPLHKNAVCFWSVMAFAAGGLTTSVAILLLGWR